MKETPLIFTAESVNAILAGTKTQTRRIMRVQPIDVLSMRTPNEWVALDVRDEANPANNRGSMVRCRFGVPGDRIWVRETWGIDPNDYGIEDSDLVHYRADDLPDEVDFWWGWKSPIFMPKWASRITLEITDIRVQKLREISERDAMAEGMTIPKHMQGAVRLPHGGVPVLKTTFASEFATAWDKINGKKHPYDSDPFVWAITFRRIE